MAAPAKTRKRNARGHGGLLRLEIIDATLRLIDTGTDRLTLTAIARAAGIAGPSIYDHFAGVAEIRFEVIRSCYSDLTARIEEAQRGLEDPVDRLNATCRAYVGYGAEYPSRYALMFRERRDQKERSAVGDRGAAALQTLVDSIADCKAAGRSSSANPYEDAVAVWSAIHGLATLRASRPDYAQLHSDTILQNIVYRLALITPAGRPPTARSRRRAPRAPRGGGPRPR
jgi:AcrR family transcriptional regulator